MKTYCILVLHLERLGYQKTIIEEKNLGLSHLLKMSNYSKGQLVPSLHLGLYHTRYHYMLVFTLYIQEELLLGNNILSTGDKLTLYHRQRVNTFFPNSDLIEFFGTSEASFISYNFNNSAPSESVGKLFQSVKMNVDQPDELGIGVLKIQSELAFSGYVEEGICYYTWIETGDFAFYDNNGYLYLRGRKHDRMIIGGRNVYPSEIENSAQQLHIFDEVIVINETHSKFGEIAVLLYTGDEEVTYKYFKSLMMQRLARYQIPSKIFKVKRMLYTQSGKIARSHMKQYYLKGEL